GIDELYTEYLQQLVIPKEVMNLFKQYDVEKLQHFIENDYNIYIIKTFLDKDFINKNKSLITFYKKLESITEIILSASMNEPLQSFESFDCKNFDLQIIFIVASKNTKKSFYKELDLTLNQIIEIFEIYEDDCAGSVNTDCVKEEISEEEKIQFELSFDGEFITPEIIISFKEEAIEHIHEFNECLLEIEKNINDYNPELINTMFRAMHTLKGLSNMFGLKPISEFAHKLENSIDSVRNDKIKMTENLVDLLLKNCDALGAAVQELVETNKITKINNKVLSQLLNLINNEPEESIESQQYAADLSSAENSLKQPFYYGLSDVDIKKFESAIADSKNIYEILFFYKQDFNEDMNNFEILKSKIELFGEIAALLFDIDEIIELDYFEPSNFDLPIKLYFISEEHISTISLLADKSQDCIKILAENDINVFKSNLENYSSKKSSSDAGSTKKKKIKPVRSNISKKNTTEINSKIQNQNKNTNIKTEQQKIMQNNKPSDTSKNASEIKTISKPVKTQELPKTKQTSPADKPVHVNKPVSSDDNVQSSTEKTAAVQSSSKETSGKPSIAGSATVRVDIEKLDTLMNLVGELLIAKTQVEQIGNNFDENILENKSKLKFVTEQLGRVTNDIQEAIMKTRMVPIGTVFNRFPRVVRDIAKARNKKVNLIIKGEETELDKTVIEEIGDPMVHLIRNALDHGIEEPEKRLAAGKLEAGNLTLNAFHEGNHIIIEIEDDGAGINADVIRKKSLEKGLLSQEESNMISDNDIIKFIFKPGFSTAEVITDISGRGVGMDVVKSNISKINGIVDIQTKVGKGTTFTIKLPLTLAIINSLLVKVGEQIFAVPLAAVIESVKIRASEIGSIEGKYEVIKLRNSVIPILRLNNQFKIESNANKDKLFIVVIGLAEEKIAMVVDDLLGQQEIVIKSLNHKIVSTPGIAGATILGDGQVVLILDISTVITNAKNKK
ncbi:chemotaxis protein CheA, partial [Candidatus Dependentiae bacterium]|nr:chemotaxis protein CheA [Candidatus Dependentiae bacterium]